MNLYVECTYGQDGAIFLIKYFHLIYYVGIFVRVFEFESFRERFDTIYLLYVTIYNLIPNNFF